MPKFNVHLSRVKREVLITSVDAPDITTAKMKALKDNKESNDWNVVVILNPRVDHIREKDNA